MDSAHYKQKHRTYLLSDRGLNCLLNNILAMAIPKTTMANVAAIRKEEQ